MPHTKDGSLHWHVRPGWTLAPLAAAAYLADDEPARAQVGQIWLPTTFEMHVVESNPDAPKNPIFEAVLMYAVEEGEIRLRMVWSSTDEAHDALDALRKDQPLMEWKRQAIMSLAADEAENDARLAERVLGKAGVKGARTNDEQDRRAQLVGDAIRAAHRTPLTRRRDRITPTLLQEVAEVYRSAWERGEAPTMAVAEHFHKTHSTAAKWVGRARKAGDLGPVPVNSSRGGEAS